MRLINKAGLLAGALTTLLILASCSDSNTSTGVTAGRDAAQEILPDDTDADSHDGDATVDDPTGPPVTDAGGGRDGDGQGSDTNSDAGGPKDACWDHDHVGNNGKLGRWVVGSNTFSNQEFIRNLANMNFAFNAPTNALPASTKQAIHCVGDSATALVWGDDPDEFLTGSCAGSDRYTHSTAKTGCGWIYVNEKGYFIMPNANLNNANLNNANLNNANLSGADLRDANLRYADLRYANLWVANLSGANLMFANLRDANLRGAYLNNANLSYAYLIRADLRYANLRDAHLYGANLWLAEFNVVTDLYGAKADSSTICPNGKPWGIGGGGNCPF